MMFAALLLALALLTALAGRAEENEAGGWVWDLPPGFPTPVVPADNPMSALKVELGRRLFHDRRLSGDGAFACAAAACGPVSCTNCTTADCARPAERRPGTIAPTTP